MNNNSNYDMEKLYREVMNDHYKNPRNKGLLNEGIKMHKRNPSCGDDINIEVNIQNGHIKEVRHDGHGCLICCSSASVMCEILQGKSIDEAKNMTQTFFNMLMAKDVDTSILEDGAIYQGVSKFPARIKCAALPWHAFNDAINGDENGK